MSAKRIKVTLVKSKHGRGARQLACVQGLGLRRIHQTVELEDSPMVRGMINKVSHLLRVEES
ncbi:MAG: 50S ribosomal protein L30 [Acidiferrobacteraceae bacterium]|jgi:large subunit ribosomal protein L30|nr:50S ribosomal protein L30 [Acidiferrobacteraceae bacterium]MBT3638831.1 50S ribosomal protein L30 [Acidiferrobacteraceae bacterium]MBT3770560.1 50S ribosomal protein L30 [Acidiferrobacteraceae bacterium]MBT3973149.1 50S ribosomal protein L30 [Acidiferrobacteraceae bacterium]MBT4405792.1 50S ribosomal protein L30 [Acidiferrobacteraceae bacterium]